ncbi:cell wall-binding repeat-containing protein, partial [Microvirga sp. 3-52]|nr:cell wall-binding repeat-containing protein [Microvirga sp. 3-52]
ATGQNYADALTGAVLAAKNDSAVLLVHARIPDVVTTYISDNDVKRLTIFGGESAVSKNVSDELTKLIQ